MRKLKINRYLSFGQYAKNQMVQAKKVGKLGGMKQRGTLYCLTHEMVYIDCTEWYDMIFKTLVDKDSIKF